MNPSRFVLDNSVVMSWCFEDETADYGQAVLESFETAEGVVPAIWPLEVGNVLLVAQRKGRLSQAQSVRFLDMIGRLPIVIDPESPSRMLKEILALAREQHLSTYDASYLDLAMRLGLPIASSDTPLLSAAQKCRVPTYRPA